MRRTSHGAVRVHGGCVGVPTDALLFHIRLLLVVAAAFAVTAAVLVLVLAAACWPATDHVSHQPLQLPAHASAFAARLLAILVGFAVARPSTLCCFSFNW